MATGKRYYWIKLKDSFMTSDVVDYLMSLPDGANYVVLYQMLCLKTVNTCGRLERRIGEVIIPYDVEKIRRDCKWFTADTVRVALNLYKTFGLVYEDNNGALVLSDHGNLVGSETDAADRMRRSRELKNKEAQDVATSCEHCANIVTTDIRDKEIKRLRDKETKRLEKDINTLSGGGGDRVCAGEENDVDRFCLERNIDGNAMLGMTGTLAQESAAFAESLFKRFSGRSPNETDRANVTTRVVSNCRDPNTGKWKAHLDRNRKELLMYAFQAASDAGKSGNWNYIDGVLTRLRNRGIATLTEAENYDERRTP